MYTFWNCLCVARIWCGYARKWIALLWWKKRFRFFPYFENAVNYADKLKRTASNTIFKFINMTKGLEFRWCSNKMIITFVSLTYLHIIIFFSTNCFYPWFIAICKMHWIYTFTPQTRMKSTEILIRRRKISLLLTESHSGLREYFFWAWTLSISQVPKVRHRARSSSYEMCCT